MGKLFGISDLHLSFSSDKPMDVFKGWENYTERIASNWKRIVTDDDTVVLSGDTSWTLNLEDAYKDFDFIHSLPGKKVIIKGNHDFWWSTANKIKNFWNKNGFDDLVLLHNNCFPIGKYAVCGTRGWLYDGKGERDKKVIERERGRLITSIESALDKKLEPIVFLHYPPAYGDFVCDELLETLESYGLNTVYYGHIHGLGKNNSLSEYGKIKMKLISCDCIDFTPFYICEYF